MTIEHSPDTCFRCGSPLGDDQSADGQHPRCAVEDRKHERGCTINIAEALQYLRRVGFIHESREIARIIEANSTCIDQPTDAMIASTHKGMGMNAIEQLKHLNRFTALESGNMSTASRNLLWNRRGEFLRDHGPALVELIEAAGAMQAAPSFPVGGSVDRFRTALRKLTEDKPG